MGSKFVFSILHSQKAPKTQRKSLATLLAIVLHGRKSKAGAGRGASTQMTLHTAGGSESI
jgi:hypothetical protein